MVDRFWKYFWISVGVTTLVGIVISMSLYIFYTQRGGLLAAVGVTYNPDTDPFESPLLSSLGGGIITLSNGYLYQNSLPLHFKSWNWQAVADWRSSEQKYEGAASLKITFVDPGGTVGMNGPSINLKGLSSLALAVYPDSQVGDLFITLYDKNGIGLGRQSLGWYTASSTLTPNMWQEVHIPLKNIAAGNTTISGYSIDSKNPGIAYVDAMQLSKAPIERALWVAPPEEPGKAYNPFANSSPAGLPYVFTPTSEALARWYSYFGNFGPGKSGEVEAGPSPVAKTTGSMSIFRGGRSWTDYKVETTIDWGEVSVFSLLARFADDGNFVSCAVSRYGESVQLYHVKNGESNFISQTPPLAVRDYEPWAGVRVGVQVKGNTVWCYVNGAEVLKATINDMSPTGTAGLETWEPNSFAAPHKIRSFSVLPLTGE